MIFEYNEMGYRVLHWTTTAPSGLVREINITDPAPEAQIGASLTLRGKTSVGPFENTLVYRIYAADGMAVTESSLMVTNTDIGQPSTFELPLDFAALGLHGRIRGGPAVGQMQFHTGHQSQTAHGDLKFRI